MLISANKVQICKYFKAKDKFICRLIDATNSAGVMHLIPSNVQQVNRIADNNNVVPLKLTIVRQILVVCQLLLCCIVGCQLLFVVSRQCIELQL